MALPDLRWYTDKFYFLFCDFSTKLTCAYLSYQKHQTIEKLTLEETEKRHHLPLFQSD